MIDFAFLESYVDGLTDEQKHDYEWFFEPGLELSEILALERKHEISIPDELKNFYRFSYGAHLGAYKILTIPEILATQKEIDMVYGTATQVILPFILVIDVGDYIVFDLEHANEDGLLLLDGFHEFNPDKWKAICFGFHVWLREMVNNNFEPFWLK